ncbi:MAG: hypothetical protein ACR2QF_01085 [Geminicoccaceae bacterium]
MVSCSLKVAALLSAFTLFPAMFLPSQSAMALDSSDLEVAAQEVHASIDAAYAILNGLPEQTRRELNTDIRLLAHSITRSVARLETQVPTIIDHSVAHNLQFLADIVHSVAYELRKLESSTSIDVNKDLSLRLGQLSEAASTRLNQIDFIVDRRIEIEDDYIVKLLEDDKVVSFKYLNRLSLDAVRYIGVSLLLIGIFFVAILIKVEKNHRPIGEFFIPKSSFSSQVLLVVFFSSCLLLSCLPGLLVGLSADSEVLAQEDSCQSLQTQNDQLRSIQQINNAKLIELTKQRMEIAAADCLGVTEATAAVERLAAVGTVAAQTVPSPTLPAQQNTSLAERNVQIDSETAVHKPQLVALLRDHFKSYLSRNLNQAVATKGPPKRPGTTSHSPPIAAIPPEPKNLTPIEPQQETEQDATSAARSLQDKRMFQKEDNKRNLIEKDLTPDPILTTEIQEAHGELELYLHFKNADDRDFVEEMSNILKKKGYKIAGVQLVENAMTTGDIRYRHQNKEKDAENIKSISETYLKDNLQIGKISLNTVNIGNLYPDLPKNRIELWLPHLR